MAIKVGTENKRNVIIAAVLFVIVAYLAVSQLMSGPPTPAPVVTAPAPLHQAPAASTLRTTSSRAPTAEDASGQSAHKLVGFGLDPALHLEKLLISESIEYAGHGRNIFSGESAPVVVEQAAASPRPDLTTAVVASGPPPPPAPPAIDLRYFGYSAGQDGKRQAFLLHGEDIFEASAGEIVNHRYKVVAVQPGSVQVIDLSYNNTQTLPMVAN